jgi:hypothetical protein
MYANKHKAARNTGGGEGTILRRDKQGSCSCRMYGLFQVVGSNLQERSNQLIMAILSRKK